MPRMRPLSEASDRVDLVVFGNPNMQKPLDPLTNTLTELEQLQPLRLRLVEALNLYVGRLQTAGAIPAEELCLDLKNYRHRLIELSKSLPDGVFQATTEANATGGEFENLSWTSINDALDVHHKQLKANDLLNRVDSLRHSEVTDFQPLVECQRDATRLKNAIHAAITDASPHDALQKLRTELDPFDKLMSLIEQRDQLSDEVWGQHVDAVITSFGRPLATAITRGRIELRSPGGSLAEVQSLELDQASTESNNAASGSLRQDSRSVFLITSRSMPSSPPIQISDPVDRFSSETAPTTTSKIADRARRATENKCVDQSILTVVQLLSEDRPALAYHLMHAIETRHPGTPPGFPAWMIHAFVLGRHVCYAKGEIARQIEDDLQHFTPQVLAAANADWNEATGFLARAAALVPALLTSSPSASAILRSFRIEPGLTHLYNYCGRLATYGLRLHGQAADLFTPNCDMARWVREASTLRQALEKWFTETVRKACPTSSTSLMFLHAHWTLTGGRISRAAESVRLWSKWQECFHLVSKLLKPVQHGQEQERTWVKTEIDRLTQCTRLEPSAEELNQVNTVGTITFPLPEMLTVIHEGMDFASQWLRLCASKPTQGRTLVSRDAEVLRDEIVERTESVLTELSAVGGRNASLQTQAAIACLKGTVEHLRAIFALNSTLALSEADPQQVVYGELAKIPDLKLNDRGMPTVDPQILEHHILKYVETTSRRRTHADRQSGGPGADSLFDAIDARKCH